MGDVARFEKGTYIDGFSDVGPGAGDGQGKTRSLPPPLRAFLWQFMLWDIRGRKRNRKVAMTLGFVLPAFATIASFAMSPFLIWAANMQEEQNHSRTESSVIEEWTPLTSSDLM
jgi:hypothetical protein